MQIRILRQQIRGCGETHIEVIWNNCEELTKVWGISDRAGGMVQQVWSLNRGHGAAGLVTEQGAWGSRSGH